MHTDGVPPAIAGLVSTPPEPSEHRGSMVEDATCPDRGSPRFPDGSAGAETAADGGGDATQLPGMNR